MLVALLFLAVGAQACNQICHLNWDPQCGSDGRTYGNLCELQSLSCQEGRTVAVAHSGECVQKAKQCNNICHMNWDPQCGSDGVTYGNLCELESLSCQEGKTVAVAHSGECVKAKQCNNICHMNWDPQCGSDGVTYGNLCELQSLSCQQGKTVAVAHSGECVKAKQCNNICHMNWDPQCGSDGVTYGNLCELQSLSCQQGQTVAVAHSGECVQKAKQCNNICHMNWDPQCGSDGVTYGNLCELESLSCQQGKSVAVAHSGSCAKKVCQQVCHANWEPVCGSDGVTYGNQCELESLSCQLNKAVVAAHKGSC